jgi:hypothetical protein
MKIGGVTAVGLALASLLGCSVYRAIDEHLDKWPRYEIPGSRASVALPVPPKFTSEELTGSPCGSLVRTSFALKGKFGDYAGHFIAMPPACAANPDHWAGLGMLVPPSAAPGWLERSRRDVPEWGSVGREVVYASVRGRARIRTVRTVVLKDGVLTLIAEGDDDPIDREDNQKFFRWVRLE